MPEAPKSDIRFYSPDGRKRRTVKGWSIESGDWGATRYGGYKEASFVLKGSAESLTPSDTAFDPQPPREDDRVRVFATPPGEAAQLRYSGRITDISREAGEPESVKITAQGFYSRVASIPVNGRFISETAVDISQAFANFASIEIKAAYPDLYIDIAASIGVTVQIEDAFNKNIGGAFTTLSGRFGGLAVFGCDEYPTSLGETPIDRLYLRAVGSLSRPDYTLPIGGNFIGASVEMASGGADVSRIVNRLKVIGTGPKYPNLLAAACNGNVGFEYPVLKGPQNTNRILDSSFEFTVGNSFWSYDGGATRKSSGLTEGPARSGSYMAELDNAGESVAQTISIDDAAGDGRVVGCWMRRENAINASAVRIKIQYKNGGADVGAVQSAAFNISSDWEEYSVLGTRPAGTVTGIVARIEYESGAGSVVDDAYCYRPEVIQDGWRVGKADASTATYSIDWAHSAVKWQGRYGLAISATANDADGDDLYIEPWGKFPVTPRQALKAAVMVKAFPGTSSEKLRVQLIYHKEDGSSVNDDIIGEYAAGYATDSAWVQLTATETQVPDDAVAANFRIVFRGDSSVYIDAPCVRDFNAPTINGLFEFVEAGPYTAHFTTSDTAFSGYDFANSIALYGDRYDTIESDAVYDYTTAQSLAARWLSVYALPLARPVVRLVGSPVTFFPGQTVRLAGKIGQWLGLKPVAGQPSRAFAIADVTESVSESGLITTTLSLEIEPQTLERVIAEIFTSQRRATSGGGNAALSAQSSGGGSSGVAALPVYPITVANGGTGADNAGNARTNLGLGSGLSVVITTAKLTPAGSNGSATYVNGVLTAQTPAT